ncbi:MAG: class I SAM-dependent methyltransferase [Acidimicrobiia bacterium]|nr:class I SAM-dependent methyltransferase [Acidimicrobiia bacterium]
MDREDEQQALHEYYVLGLEQSRLDSGPGLVEFERTKEIVLRHLPDARCDVADIGGGPGRYALWLAGLGYAVRHRDLVSLHVEQLTAASAGRDDIDTAVCDATRLDLDDQAVDAVLLLGPLYHLPRRRDRLQALREARRIVTPGGPVFVAAISRWAARLNGVLVEQLYRHLPEILDEVERVERSGELRPLFPGSFTGYSHRPRQLAAELRAAELDVVDLVAVEGPTALVPDLTERMKDPIDTQVVLEAARALERVPELLGAGSHLIATGRRPAH